jgi:hypothetical protein
MHFLLGLFAFISFTYFLILVIFFPDGDCIKSGAVAGGLSGDFSGLYSKAHNGGDEITTSNISLSRLEKFVSSTLFLLDENNKLKKPFFFGLLTVLKSIIFGLIVSSDTNLLFVLRTPDGELNAS